MRRKNEALGGVKVVNSRSMVVNDCMPVIALAESSPEVTKVMIGEVSQVGAGKRRIKAMPARAGLKVTVRGPNMQQTLLIRTSDPEKFERKLETLWMRQLR